MRTIGVAALVAAASSLATCGSSSQEPPADRSMRPQSHAGIPPGCSAKSVATQFGGFLEAVSERRQDVALHRLAPRPDFLVVTLYKGARPGEGRVDAETPKAVFRNFAATIPAGEPTALLVVAVGKVAPFASAYEEKTGPGRRTAGAEIVARLGRGGVLSGKVGIDCEASRMYLGAMQVTRGLRQQRHCGELVRLGARRPVLCVI